MHNGLKMDKKHIKIGNLSTGGLKYRILQTDTYLLTVIEQKLPYPN